MLFSDDLDKARRKLKKISNNFICIMLFSDDLDKARRKLKKAEHTSDLNTECEEEVTSRRVVQKPRKILDSSSDEEISSRVVQKPRKILDSSSDEEISRFERPPRIPNIIIRNKCSETTSETLRVAAETGSPSVSSLFPNTVNHIAEIELFLSNEEAFSALSSYLASLGGRNVTTRTNRILRELLTDEVAALYNFYGSKRYQKLAFVNLRLSKVIIRAVKIGCSEASNLDIQNAQRWSYL
ncbi:protein of unknown function (DUF4806) [Popillia japonica]|uniref:DUF4806 domain-containing protein n=1 Tax=Popillia japonica TaxID=7064 RepID=A0AAW1HFV8_POPJA